MTRPAPYSRLIAPLAPGYDPRHVEAYMRAEFGTLDHLSDFRFRDAALQAILCINTDGLELAERVAQSYGL